MEQQAMPGVEREGEGEEGAPPVSEGTHRAGTAGRMVAEAGTSGGPQPTQCIHTGKRKRIPVPAPQRRRARRFSAQENHILLSCVLEHYEVLYGGRLSSRTTVATRTELWEEVRVAVAEAGGPHRDIDSLRKRFNVTKRGVRQHMAAERQHAMGTGGGGPFTPALTPLEQELAERLGPIYLFGLPEALDTAHPQAGDYSIMGAQEEEEEEVPEPQGVEEPEAAVSGGSTSGSENMNPDYEVAGPQEPPINSRATVGDAASISQAGVSPGMEANQCPMQAPGLSGAHPTGTDTMLAELRAHTASARCNAEGTRQALQNIYRAMGENTSELRLIREEICSGPFTRIADALEGILALMRQAAPA